ncbi:hypothetical protein HF086_012036 [Spodoptera exigua]|uniref:Uncharacterized protein n=1 Tax=Spodoptera exigua TaxID=7107 RepID=A0A922MJ29_SPOEX|nr:hypothetical protein HF086_012036 [Spodoptera exigua]
MFPADCVRQTVSNLNVLDYTCAECRRTGITSRAAAVRLAPRTIATLFMAKRRFNKYAHRQYLASRRRQAEEARLEAAGEDSVDAGDAGDAGDTGDAADAEPLRVELRDDMSEGSDAPPDLADTSDPLDAANDA